MRWFSLLLFALSLSTGCQTPKHDVSNKIRVRMGLLRLPFGTIAKLEGVYQSGDELRKKAYSGVLLMKVLKVNGKKVDEVVSFRFDDDLRANKEKLKKTQAGQSFSVMAYESGGYVGLPHNAFDFIPIRATSKFHFESKLIVLK